MANRTVEYIKIQVYMPVGEPILVENREELLGEIGSAELSGNIVTMEDEDDQEVLVKNICQIKFQED